MKVKLRSAFDRYNSAYTVTLNRVPKRQDLIKLSDQLFLVLGAVDGVVIVAGLPNTINPINACL